jgi:hypothetical protein
VGTATRPASELEHAAPDAELPEANASPATTTKESTMKLVALLSVLLLSGCASFQLGGMAYCPAKHDCSFTVQK